MILYIAHAGHEHAENTNSLTHHIPTIILITLFIAAIGVAIYWLLQRPEKVPEKLDDKS